MTYSLDYRKRVFKIKDKEKLTYKEVAQRFAVGIATLFRWKKKLEPQKTRNKPATKIDMEALSKDVEDYPDLYQEERAEKFGVSQRAIGYALKRLNLSYKKNSISS